MSGFLVDTDWVIQVLHGDAVATQTLIDRAGNGLSLSVISYGELYEGAYYARDPRSALAALTAFLEGKDLLPLTTAIAEQFAILRGRLPRNHRQQIGDMDLLIAATAIEHDLDPFTYNRRDFTLVPGLRIYAPEPSS